MLIFWSISAHSWTALKISQRKNVPRRRRDHRCMMRRSGRWRSVCISPTGCATPAAASISSLSSISGMFARWMILSTLKNSLQPRAHHPSDPPLASFPLTTQITPRMLDSCRACNKVPAVYAIVGDIRFGESPFVICSPCWRWMGPPKAEDADKVQVVPLPKHEFGWSG